MPPFSSVWQYYTTEQWTDNEGRVRRTSTCNFCNKTYRSNATKMTDHLVKQCRNCPENIRAELGRLVENGSHDDVEVALVIPQPVESDAGGQGQDAQQGGQGAQMAVMNSPQLQITMSSPRPVSLSSAAPRMTAPVKTHRWFKDTKAVWKHFVTDTHKDEHGNSKSTSYCMYCNLRYTFPNVTKMRKHLLVKCRQVPQSVIDEIMSTGINQWSSPRDSPTMVPVNSIRTSHPSTSTMPSADHLGPSTSTQQQTASSQLARLIHDTCGPPKQNVPSSSLSSAPSLAAAKRIRLEHTTQQLLNKMQPRQMKMATKSTAANPHIDSAIARAVYSSNTPLNFAENHYWQEAFRLLNPSYNPPKKSQLTGQLLDEEYERVSAKIAEKVNKCTCIAVIATGWTNATGYVNITVSTPQPVFLKSIDTKESECSAAYIADIICGVIEEVGAAKVLVLLTDNTSNNMRAAWKLIQQQYPHITAAGCAGSSLEGLLDDIMKLETLETLSKKSTRVVQSVKAAPDLYDALKKKQEEKHGRNLRMIQLPGQTQQSVVLMMASLIACKDSLLEIIAQTGGDGLAEDISSLVLDEENKQFWLPLELCLDVLQPIVQALTKVTSTKALLSDVPQEFSKITAGITTERLQASSLSTVQIAIQQAIEESKAYCCFPLHHACNILDPRYRGQGLNEEDFAGAMDIIIKLAIHLRLDPGKVMANLAEFQAREGRLWSMPSVWAAAQHTDPSTWWKGLCADQKITPIASNLLSIPLSSAVSMRKRCDPGDNYSSLKATNVSGAKMQKIITIRSNLHLFREGYDEEEVEEEEEEEVAADDDESNQSPVVTDMVETEGEQSAPVAMPIPYVELKKEHFDH